MRAVRLAAHRQAASLGLCGNAYLSACRHATIPKSPAVESEHLSATNEDLDAAAQEQMRIAKEIGEDNFEENLSILKQVAMRGGRAFIVCAVGLGSFGFAMKRKKKQLAAEENGEEADGDASASGSAVEEPDDPTRRYLEEMRGLGFDVDTLEEELAAERSGTSTRLAKA